MWLSVIVSCRDLGWEFLEKQTMTDFSILTAFSIISKTKGWWVVYRATPSNSSFSTSYPRKSAWVPAGCLLETSVPPLSLADPSLSSPLTNAASIPILPHYIVSISTAGTALMDYVKSGSDELEVAKGTSLRILKRYNHCERSIAARVEECPSLTTFFIDFVVQGHTLSRKKRENEVGYALPSSFGFRF